MSTEKVFTEFHLLKNEALNEFEFELPAQLLTATLIKACTDIPPDQIGIIEANINLRHSDVDKSVENAIRKYMQSKKSYGSGKSSTKVLHCAMNDWDVLLVRRVLMTTTTMLFCLTPRSKLERNM